MSKKNFFILIITLILIIVILKIAQNSVCPKYKDCMPRLCPYFDESKCQDWTWDEEECKKIDWYCKGRTEITQ